MIEPHGVMFVIRKPFHGHQHFSPFIRPYISSWLGIIWPHIKPGTLIIPNLNHTSPLPKWRASPARTFMGFGCTCPQDIRDYVDHRPPGIIGWVEVHLLSRDTQGRITWSRDRRLKDEINTGALKSQRAIAADLRFWFAVQACWQLCMKSRNLLKRAMNSTCRAKSLPAKVSHLVTENLTILIASSIALWRNSCRTCNHGI